MTKSRTEHRSNDRINHDTVVQPPVQQQSNKRTSNQSMQLKPMHPDIGKTNTVMSKNEHAGEKKQQQQQGRREKVKRGNWGKYN